MSYQVCDSGIYAFICTHDDSHQDMNVVENPSLIFTIHYYLRFRST